MIEFITNHGNFTVELFTNKSPKTASNFRNYCKSGFYNNTIFHRVIDNFMIQGGGFTSGLKEKDTLEPIENEADNGLSNSRGTLAMARTMDPHSASAQFFINLVDNSFLDHQSKTDQGYGYCVFGKVIEGMDVVDKIKTVETGNYGMHQDVPKEEVVILDVKIHETI